MGYPLGASNPGASEYGLKFPQLAVMSNPEAYEVPVGAAAEDEVAEGLDTAMAATWLPVKASRANVVCWLTVIVLDKVGQF